VGYLLMPYLGEVTGLEPTPNEYRRERHRVTKPPKKNIVNTSACCSNAGRT
jgi:hypothetical protein